jgi:Mlc titration factor MtfA (ptsG expression regulator)
VGLKKGLIHHSNHAKEKAALCLAGFSYYQKLSLQGKEEFIQRTLNFIDTKLITGEENFSPGYCDKIHLAAAATQLTFGLPDFTFTHFETIILYPGIFQLNENCPLMKGAATPDGIVRISIADFEKGYENPNDKLNVGLHELGHALFMEFLRDVNDEKEEYFQHQTEVMQPYLVESGHILQTHNDGDGFLRHYAFTNRHEFFAVCIEHFFEAPAEFKIKLPALYKTLMNLLNQDPSNLSGDYSTVRNFERISLR